MERGGDIAVQEELMMRQEVCRLAKIADDEGGQGRRESIHVTSSGCVGLPVFMLVGIALLLRNLWVLCQQAASIPGSVPFKLILAWISHSYSKSLHLIAGFAAKPRHPDFATKPVPL